MENKTFELLEKMYIEFIGLKNEMADFKNEMTDFKNEMTDFKNEMTDFKNEMTDFKNEMTDFKKDTTSRLKKIEISQEKMQKDIKAIAEVQISHMEQNERQHLEIKKEFNKRATLIEGAVRHLAGETLMNTSAVTELQKELGETPF